MKVPSLRLPTSREARAPDNAQWANALLAPRDAQLKAITVALQGLIGFLNLNWEPRVLLVRDEEEFEVVAQKVKGPIAGVILLAAEAEDHARLSWHPISTGKVRCEVIWDILQPEPLLIALLLIGT